MENRKDAVGPAGQRFTQGSSSSTNASSRLPDFGASGGVRPVLNYSIQTGEEFSLEFMRERVMPKKHFVPSTSGEQNFVTGYMDLRGMRGVSNTLSESGSEVSTLTKVENPPSKEIQKKSFTEIESTDRFASTRSVPRGSSGDGSSRGVSHGYSSSEASDISSKKMKFLCSFGGKILPRPIDRKLRYVGGDTHIIRVSMDISWQELMQKTMAIYNQPHAIKYQLPDEDLDALISVTCDEDLKIMLEECGVLEGGEGSQKIRLFLFPSADSDDTSFNLGSAEEGSEVQYVVAVNGLDVAARKTSSGNALQGTSASDLDQLVNLDFNTDQENTSRDAIGLSGIHASPLVLATTMSSQIQGNLSTDRDTHLPSYQGRGNQYMDGVHHAYSGIHHPDSLYNIDSRSSIPLSMPSDYGYNSQYASDIGNSVAMPSHGEKSFNQDLTEASSGSTRMHKQEVLIAEVLHELKNGVEHVQSLQNDFNAYHNASVLNSMETQVPFAASVPEDLSSLPLPKDNGKHLEVATVPTIANVVAAGQGCEFNEDDCYSSSGPFTSRLSDFEADMTDHSYNDLSPLPERVYHSERIPRDQAESLNRLSKSDDSFGSQYLILHSHADVAKVSTAEAITPAPDGIVFSPIENSSVATKPPILSPPSVVDRQMKLVKYKELGEKQNKQPETISAPAGSGISKFPEHPVVGNERADTITDEQGNKAGWKIQKPKTSNVSLTSSDDRSIFNEDKISHEANMSSKYVEKLTIADETGAANSNLKVLTAKEGEEAPVVKQQETASTMLEELTRKATCVSDVEHASALPCLAISTMPASAEESMVPNKEKRVLIDINDRFPLDILSDFFSNARIASESSSFSPLHKDDAGLSLNMQNHEPKRWSFFRNLAQDEFARKGVSLMDQDSIDYSSTLAKTEEAVHRSYQLASTENEGVDLGNLGSQIDLNDELLLEPSNTILEDSRSLNTAYISSPIGHLHLAEKSGGLRVKNPFSNVAENLRVPISEHEESKLEDAEAAGPLMDASLDDIDFTNLQQIIKNEDLEELRELGSGTFGTVYHGKWRGTDVAIKRIKKSCFTGRSSEQERLTHEFWREAGILSKLHHPNVVAFYGVVQDGPGGTLATVTEFMVNGSLRHVLLRKDKYLDRRKRLIIAMDAAFGMEYLHSKNIVHFDLKCDNLLVNLKDQTRPICKVGDFGLSKIKRNTLVSGGVRGTLPWMAPELLNGGSNKVSEKVDVFSFGIVMWEILTGEEPYANMHYGAIIGGIVNNTLRPPVPSSCDLEWRRLMEQCWAPDPVRRPSFTEVAGRLRAMSIASQTRATR
ncbi:uncharacterized protein [Typha angustifolia]|uniref:uncharacterized protein isoform X1 n=1 Tax=Typha angustifolia TaxID=59011 RepID=UPI003C2D99F9